MDFKLWFENEDFDEEDNAAKDASNNLAIVRPLIEQLFGSLELLSLSTADILSAHLSTGQALTFSVLKNGLKQVKISFTVPFDLRDKYGKRSSKDVATNQELMPGSLDMARRLKALNKLLIQNGFTMIAAPINQRRQNLFQKLKGEL